MRRDYDYGPRPSIPEPRPYLLGAVAEFVRAARRVPGVTRIALIGSLTTAKPIPKDADMLVTIEARMIEDAAEGAEAGTASSGGGAFARLAAIGRRLKGAAQKINLGADIFLAAKATPADAPERYIGRVCHYRECFPRRACRARHCRRVPHLADDLDIVKLKPDTIAAPPLILWPAVVRGAALPEDVERMAAAIEQKE